MFSERLENLIEAALQDGVLTDQEKASIIKRAQAEGEDIDEVEIYIQSLLQKRQQELNQKKKEANAIQTKEDQEYEKERSQTLRKCPKCGTLIPNLSNVCPDCGYIIETTGIDKKVVLLIQLLRECINRVEFDEYKNVFNIPSRICNFETVKKEVYDEFSNLYIFDENIEDDDSHVSVLYDYNGIVTEASLLYGENEHVKTLLKEIHMKEKKILLDLIKEEIDIINCTLTPNNNDYGNENQYNRHIGVLKNYYSIMSEKYNDLGMEDIDDVKKQCQQLENVHNSLHNDPEYIKQSIMINKKTAYNEKHRYDTPIFERLLWGALLLLLTCSGWIIILLFFEKGRDFLKSAYDKVINNE